MKTKNTVGSNPWVSVLSISRHKPLVVLYTLVMLRKSRAEAIHSSQSNEIQYPVKYLVKLLVLVLVAYHVWRVNFILSMKMHIARRSSPPLAMFALSSSIFASPQLPLVLEAPPSLHQATHILQVCHWHLWTVDIMPQNSTTVSEILSVADLACAHCPDEPPHQST